MVDLIFWGRRMKGYRFILRYIVITADIRYNNTFSDVVVDMFESLVNGVSIIDGSRTHQAIKTAVKAMPKSEMASAVRLMFVESEKPSLR